MLESAAMGPPISLTAPTDSCVPPCMPRIWQYIASVALADSSADFIDRGHKLLRCGGDRLHVAGCFFRCAGDLARQALRGVRGSRQRSRSLFKLNGGSRNVRDDRADGRLEIIGKANQLSAARGAARPVLGILGGGIAFGF